MGSVIVYACGCVENIDIFLPDKKPKPDVYCKNLDKNCSRMAQRGIAQDVEDSSTKSTPESTEPVEKKEKEKDKNAK